MALIKCYECGKEISSLAPVCPGCGAPKQEDADTVEDKPRLNIPSPKSKPKSDKDRIADWLIDKQKGVECEPPIITSEKPETSKKTAYPNEGKRSFSSRLLSGSLYGAAGFLAGFGVGRAPRADSFEVEIASWVTVGIFFGFILFIIGLFGSVKGGKKAIIIGLIICICLKAAQCGGSNYGSRKGRELAEEFQRRESRNLNLPNNKPLLTRYVPLGWITYSFKEHGISFAAPGHWTTIQDESSYLWSKTGRYNNLDFNVYFNVKKAEAFRGISNQEYINGLDKRNIERMTMGLGKKLEVMSLDKTFKWADKMAILMQTREISEGVNYRRITLQSLIGGKMYSLLFIVNEKEKEYGVRMIKELSRTFRFSM